MPRTYKPRLKLYTEASVAAAIKEVTEGASVRSTAKKYHMSTFMLRQRYQQSQGLIDLKKQGVKPRLGPEIEEKLAGCIKRMAQLGFGPTLNEMMEIVGDYLRTNELTHLFHDKLPGYDWAKNFMQRHKLSLKKSGLMQVARKNVTSDPFVIYGFYSMLETEINRLGIGNRPECFWNLDESGFPTDASKWKTVGPVGSKTIRVSCGANRENTTVLAVCCADGTALDPLIVFKGKNIMSNWHGDEALPDTYYATSDNGWMTTDIFHAWFETFVEKTKQTRPLILLFDGHLTHTSASTIELAMKENISIIKLPAHTTDALQPLDVACFNPLKTYEKHLTDRVHQTGAREPLRKADFCNLISKIWRLGLSEKNIKSGFRATGIFPLNSSKYQVDRLDKVKLATYKSWLDAGKPVQEDGSPLLAKPLQAEDVNIQHVTPTSIQAEFPPGPSSNQPSTSGSVPAQRRLNFPPNTPSTTDESASLNKSLSTLTKELQKYAPPGMRYVVTLVPKEDETTLDQIIKSRGRPSTPAPPAKRHRISMHGAILTDNEYRKQLKEKELPKDKQPKKKPAVKETSKTDIDSLEEYISDNESLYSLDDSLDDTNVTSLENTMKASLERRILHDKLPKSSNVEVGDFYAVFWDKPRTYYWGKVLKILKDNDDSEFEVEMTFLKRSVPSSDPQCLRWDWPKVTDVDVVSVSNFLAGPAQPHLEMKVRGKQNFYFEEEAQACDSFKTVMRHGFPTPKKTRP